MASDLPLVVELMEMVESAKIFSPDLPGGTALEEHGDKKYKSEMTIKPKLRKSDENLDVSKSSEISKKNSRKNHRNSELYDMYNNDYIATADAFFANPPKENSRPGSGRIQDSSDSGFRSDTEQKLSQFFLLNKY